MTFVTFDAAYLERLEKGDPPTEGHFIQYFGELLTLKLRYQVRSPQTTEDIRQETLFRVLKIVRAKGIAHPERLGAFVHTVCKNVLYEHWRRSGRQVAMAENAPEPADVRVNIEAPIWTREMRSEINEILAELPPKDRTILRMMFLEEVPKETICQVLRVDGDYLRVLLHRAKSRFRAVFEKRGIEKRNKRSAMSAGKAG